eukprot:GHVS01103288.1.p1 GENE.GHVS01103288.1~~GHVS01103288.1.p1  ORF type:complete len:429 (+),score=48.87 GHVS01103288.1:253-1539(+)
MPERLMIKNLAAEPWKIHYADIKLSTKATDSPGIACSSEYIAAPWDVGGGGMIGVMKLEACTRKPDVIRIKGHTAQIFDVAFSPFYSSLLASCSEDQTIRIWDIPEDPPANQEMKDAVAILSGHTKKVILVQMNPVADFVLASVSSDQTVKIWDLERKSSVFSHSFDNPLYDAKWNEEGSMLATASKDKHLNFLDPRQSAITGSVESHEGAKAIRCCWMEGVAGTPHHVLTTGFSKRQEREVAVWDGRSLSEPVFRFGIDRTSQCMYPTFDDSTGMLYLAGKGDANFKYYHFHAGKLSKVDEYRSTVPMKSFGFIPKRSVDTKRCEIGRFLKNEGGKLILPISLIVPRKNADVFQADLYPTCPLPSPSLTCSKWLSGETAGPKMGELGEQAVERGAPKFVRKQTAVVTTKAVMKKQVQSPTVVGPFVY